MNPADTIAAVATPPGSGGIAVLRLSGRRALAVADRCLRSAGGRVPSAFTSRMAVFGEIHREGVRVDEGVITVFRGPKSFTGEDTVEIACHGGILVTRRVLEALLAAGARPAEPGEFTCRAFLNGRMDLAQAEAVADLIHAQTDRALGTARAQLSGALSRRIEALRDTLMSVLAHIEAHIDFPDEDIAPDTTSALASKLAVALEGIESLLRTAREGRMLRQGVRTALVGRPNAGKSSLLNRLLGHDRAIVSPVAGTTRDTLEEVAQVRGIPLVLVDTAGLRESEDLVEREGIRRSREAASEAELILHVVDASVPWCAEEEALAAAWSGKGRICVANKCDLPGAAPVPGSIAVSCRTGDGFDALEQAIEDRLVSGAVGQGGDDGVAIGVRHQRVLERAREAVIRTRSGLESQQTLELVAFELRVALTALGEVVGKTSVDDLLDSIFSQFCLGK
jgi:tRNA modification GTPase